MHADTDSFFVEFDDGSFGCNPPARGPWDADSCHAGPVAGLVARACEALAPGMHLTRLGLTLLAPVPMSGFTVQATTSREGRTMTLTGAEVRTTAGELCAFGTGLHLTVRELGEVPSAPVEPIDFDGRVAGSFPAPDAVHGQPFFLDGAEIAYPPGEDTSPGPTTLWMRTVPLVAGEVPSTFQRICPLADCGSGVSRNARLDEFTFMNPDVTIHLHRCSDAEWFASEAVSMWNTTGIGLATSIIHDPHGPVGTASQPLLLRRSGGRTA